MPDKPHRVTHADSDLLRLKQAWPQLSSCSPTCVEGLRHSVVEGCTFEIWSLCGNVPCHCQAMVKELSHQSNLTASRNLSRLSLMQAEAQ